MSTPTPTSTPTTVASSLVSSSIISSLANSTTSAPSSPSVLTYTYSLPPITRIDGLDSFDIGDRIMQLISSGSDGERIVRGFLMGVAFGVILGGVLCCWVPCFGAKQRERRARRRARLRAMNASGTEQDATISVEHQERRSRLRGAWLRIRRRT